MIGTAQGRHGPNLEVALRTLFRDGFLPETECRVVDVVHCFQPPRCVGVSGGFDGEQAWGRVEIRSASEPQIIFDCPSAHRH